ncbi:glycosyltransferase [Mycobacterium sp. MYCO198283]|uniref:glycosyltransferase n=1 Tax=Mycobacterium sp. MYCO198283 TaxID=2883505 RepID=UPI001E37B532|nr:glycosyltransferase [Mycobacterium sp. MYCO198283]MCG5431680.1 glycosyltransferase [Mycobacterium sp. MYCO198283]
MRDSAAGRSVVLWHVHGSWTESFVQGRHDYLIPRNAAGDADGRGLCGRHWPNAREVPADRLADEPVDLVILQRPAELDLAQRWLGRRPGIDVPAVFVEHNAPRPSPTDSVHPLAERADIPLVHVTDFNRLMWDNGRAPTLTIDHGIIDPGERYTGELPAAAALINEPVRRGRVVGTDLLPRLGAAVPVDVWGMGTEELDDHGGTVRGHGDLAPPALHDEVSRRRVYVHTARWTSLGLSLLEAMHLGMPVVAVASTMAPLAVPSEAGVVSADPDTLAQALSRYVADPELARTAGKSARAFVLAHYGLARFLADWDRLIEEMCR